MMTENVLLVGIDIGSTTTKIMAIDKVSGEVVFSDYERHGAAQLDSVRRAAALLKEACPGRHIRLALTGSGAQPVAKALGVPFVQEVVANSIALCREHSEVRTAIELGGQDAKMIFFRQDEKTGACTVSDMRMNGSCAGGTGAFIDEIAAILKVPVEEFDALAAKGSCVYDISGRCGVYAKTDIQPLLNQGVSKQDLALSAFHAIAKQTIGGLAQGLDIEKPVIFEGGPLTFNPTLVRVFCERLHLSGKEAVLPERPELMIAYGAALSLETMFQEESEAVSIEDMMERIEEAIRSEQARERKEGRGAAPFFESREACEAFCRKNRLPSWQAKKPEPGKTIRAYLGIDSGSTTTKFVLLDENEQLLDSFYGPNEGEPLMVAKKALLAVRDRYRRAGAHLDIIAAGTTGYGEMLFHKAFHTECHAVETVAHVRAAEKYVKDATFILDIGGQDMKAIWLDHGIITNIVVNEACSSGCGSFLENFASSLHIPVEKIAESAFSSQSPAALGSRCTVFMNSSIVTEQRNGKLPEDIMAGLCRSIIENVFTKVIRISNLDSLGDKIVVQGGTFQNDAVLRAMEEYIGREVVRAPYPGIMGAIGAALIAKEQYEAECAAAAGSMSAAKNAADAECAAAGVEHGKARRTFIGLDALEDFSYRQESNSPCPFCTNHCKRTIIAFSDGSSWVTNNRCERGEILGDPKDQTVRARLLEKNQQKNQAANLFRIREKLLFQKYPAVAQENTAAAVMQMSGAGSAGAGASGSLSAGRSAHAAMAGMLQTGEKLDAASLGVLPAGRKQVIGLPRVLSFWETMPFWTTFWRSLGFEVKLSDPSTRKMYEDGLSAVTSDTVCFPAKLVHGHIRNLVNKGVDRIFMPSISTVKSENTESTSESMCAVVKGYPLVIRNSDNPEKRWGVPFDMPMFFWYEKADRDRQLKKYIADTFRIPEDLVRDAIRAADQAQETFHRELRKEGQKVLDEVSKNGTYAVVLASRPYQNDALVNHELPEMFASLGIPVLTVDSLPGTEKVDLSKSRLDIVNNYHARMLSGAVMAAENSHLEYVQLVSFGCGHDAYLSDEIIRMMKEISGKTPLILKLDESDVQGPLRIRVRSFTETVAMRRSRNQRLTVRSLPDPYPVKFTRQDKKEKLVLVPNTSHAFCRVMSAALHAQHIRAVPLEVGREEAIRLGKQYVHNDICFPAQIVIGEALAALRSGKYKDTEVAIGMAKYIGDCRLTHYSALLRKVLDDAGYAHVPILTNDDEDYHNLHPGFRMNLLSALRIAFAMPMIDVLEELLRKIRPYELKEGSADQAFEAAMDAVAYGLQEHGISGARRGFEKAIELMKQVPYDRSRLRPRVLIVGEYLLNFHPGANHEIERYLERGGFEIIEARMTDVIRKTYFCLDAQIREYRLKRPVGKRVWYGTANHVFDLAHDMTDSIAKRHPLYTPACRLTELVKDSDPIIHHTFDAGEGVLIPGEILHHAKQGCRAFVILQPFGCLPNHVVGRGVTKKLKELYPDVQILPLDYDPDVSFANIENRLQMLIMNAKINETT